VNCLGNKHVRWERARRTPLRVLGVPGAGGASAAGRGHARPLIISSTGKGNPPVGSAWSPCMHAIMTLSLPFKAPGLTVSGVLEAPRSWARITAG